MNKIYIFTAKYKKKEKIVFHKLKQFPTDAAYPANRLHTNIVARLYLGIDSVCAYMSWSI